jgi:hypothetical protein
MSIVKMIIPGQYWDTQIYQGRLYLFGIDGSLTALNWDHLVDNVVVEDSLRLALKCAFKRSDYLYRVAATGLFYDSEVRQIVSRRFASLASRDLVLTPQELQSVLVGRQDSPFSFPHSDSMIYRRRMFVASKRGVHVSSCTKGKKRAVDDDVEEIWDAPTTGIEASWGSLALAGGDEGLWESGLDFGESPFPHLYGPRPRQVAKEHCSECHWTYYSIFGSSSRGPGFLASYRRSRRSGEEAERRLEEVIPDSVLFAGGARGIYSWAAQDKICQFADGEIRVAKYQPWKKEPLRYLGAIPLERHGSKIVSARVALFGTIVELDSGLAVINSDGSFVEIEGEPVSWRIFPRSRHYENHLHVCYEDRLEILSFNHDYLVPQDKKISGISVSSQAWQGRAESLAA